MIPDVVHLFRPQRHLRHASEQTFACSTSHDPNHVCMQPYISCSGDGGNHVYFSSMHIVPMHVSLAHAFTFTAAIISRFVWTYRVAIEYNKQTAQASAAKTLTSLSRKPEQECATSSTHFQYPK